MSAQFGALRVGARFEADGEVWRKTNDQYVIDNAQMLRLRQTRCFLPVERVTVLRPPVLSFWRRWLLTRSLRWQVAGFTSWARWSWRLARVLASETTDQAMAAHVTTRLMMGE